MSKPARCPGCLSSEIRQLADGLFICGACGDYVPSVSDNNSLITLPPSVSVGPVGLSFGSGITFEEWQDVGRKLKAARSTIHWLLGDWLNYGERRWGEVYTQALEETPYAYQTLRNDKFVAGRVDLSRRRDKLSWSHHEAVADLEPDVQDKLLDVAEAMSLNRDEFRKEIARYKENLELSHTLYDRLGAYPEFFQWDGDKSSRYQNWLEQGKEFFE